MNFINPLTLSPDNYEFLYLWRFIIVKMIWFNNSKVFNVFLKFYIYLNFDKMLLKINWLIRSNIYYFKLYFQFYYLNLADDICNFSQIFLVNLFLWLFMSSFKFNLILFKSSEHLKISIINNWSNKYFVFKF